LKYLKKIDLDPFNEEWDDDDDFYVDLIYYKYSLYVLKDVLEFICFNNKKNNSIFLDKISIKIPKIDILKIVNVDEFIDHYYYNTKMIGDLNNVIKIIIEKQRNIIHLIPFVTPDKNDNFGVIVIFYKIEKTNLKKYNYGYNIISSKNIDEDINLLKYKMRKVKLFNNLDRLKYFNKDSNEYYDTVLLNIRNLIINEFN